MYILINTDQMELIAKHPNLAALHELGIIMCPDECAVLPLDQNVLDEFVDAELELLYLCLTLTTIPEYNRQEMVKVLLYYLNEVEETVLDPKDTGSQAQYCIDWGIEGYCSFVKGKREPSDEEGLWQNQTIDANLIVERKVIADPNPISFKAARQQAWRPGRENN